jgi:hypothetical protein
VYHQGLNFSYKIGSFTYSWIMSKTKSNFYYINKLSYLYLEARNNTKRASSESDLFWGTAKFCKIEGFGVSTNVSWLQN